MDEDVDDVVNVQYCRTCFKTTTDEDSTKIFDDTSTYSKKLREMLKFTLTEINLNVHRGASVCFDCQRNLEISYDFIKHWLSIDEKYFYWAKYHQSNICIRREHNYAGTTTKTKTLPELDKIDHVDDTIIDLTVTDDISTIINDNIINSNGKKKKMVRIRKKKPPTSLLQILTVDGTIAKHRQRMQPVKRLCEICGKSCLPHMLQKHLKSHQIENQIKPADQITQCHICGKQLKQRALLGHLRYTHGDNVLQHYQCEHCGKTFLLRARYRKHLLVHSAVEYPCDICGKILKYKHSLENHKNFYHGNVKYKCDQCPRNYCQLKDLKRHKFRIHELRLPLYGTRKTPHTNNNSMHIMDDGRYQCLKCSKLFTKRTNCWIHIRRHEQRTFPCDLCKKSLRSRFTLKRHYQIFHLDYCHYYCRCCGKRYYKQIELQNHMLRIHHETTSVDNSDNQYLIM